MGNFTRALLVGLGSPQGDDQAGWRVAEEFAARNPGRAVRKAASPADLFDWLDGVERLVLCDACRGSGPVGAVARWTWPSLPFERIAHRNSHGLDLKEALTIADRLGRLPRVVEIIGIEIDRDGPGDELTPKVQAAVRRVVDELT